MGSWIAESPLKAQRVEALGGWLALQPASANAATRRRIGTRIAAHSWFVKATPVWSPVDGSAAGPMPQGKKTAPRLSPAGPGLRDKLASSHTRCGPLWITPPRRSWLFCTAPALWRGASRSSGDLGDQLEGAQARGVLVEVGDDDQFIRPGFRDQRVDAGPDRLGRAGDRAGEHPLRLCLLHRRPIAFDIVDRRL